MERKTRDSVLTSSLLLCLLTQLCQVSCQLCGSLCHCPWPVPRCPVGVSLILDGCHCCQVCARQEGKPCTEKYVCDSQRGLRCDYSASYPGGPGECISQNMLGCEMNGMRYEEGHSFQPSCSQLCYCTGGGVTCVPLCTDDLQMPSRSCPNPQLLRLPGRCCREWVCDSLDNSIFQDTSAVDRAERSWQDISGQNQSPGSNCIEQSTEWSPCSHSCGLGVSTRMSNRNWACRPQTQTRLCQVRPCHGTTVPTCKAQLGSRLCESSYRSLLPIRLEHQGCYSTRTYKPRFCGLCSDSRCCSPYQTRTTQMGFRCPQGRVTQHPVMVIESCVCHYNCPHPLLANVQKNHALALRWPSSRHQ